MHISSRRELAERLFGIRNSSRSAPEAVPAPAAPPSDATFARQLAARATFGSNLEVVGDIEAMGPEQWLEQQLDPDSISDADCEQEVANVSPPTTSGAADLRMLTRALKSRRQLAWRMTYFLNNHFATYRQRTAEISEVNEDDKFHGACFDKFAKVLQISAASPAMIDFLDSQSNIAGNPNENYARELLELHTVSIDGGYTENDVAELARVFTGWRRVNVGSQPITHSYFEFAPTLHDTGAKTLSLGWSTPGISGPSGRHEGADVLNFLAAHPRTASFFCQKLCRYFVSDTPPLGLVNRVRQAFATSGGDLRVTVRALFLDPEFVQPRYLLSKTYDGFEYIVSVVRRFKGPVSISAINERISRLRSLPHQYHLPTGYGETAESWIGPGHALERWDFADDFAHDRIAGTSVPWTGIFPSLPSTGGAWEAGLSNWLFDEPLPDTTKWAVALYMDNMMASLPSHPTWAQVLPHARDLLTLMLQLPEAQMH